MSNATATVTARRYFDQAMAVLQSDTRNARRLFRDATEIDPAMADAWLGRIASGDSELAT